MWHVVSGAAWARESLKESSVTRSGDCDFEPWAIHISVDVCCIGYKLGDFHHTKIVNHLR